MAKTIFNTTEKSNFILNMKISEYHGFNQKILLGFLILMPLFCLPLEFFKVASIPGIAFAIVGVFAMVFAFIGFMKKATHRSLYLPAGLFGGMAIFGIVSVIRSYDYTTALTGADGRNEGLLSVIFYGCIFLIAAQLGTEENHRKLFKGILCMGLAECGWGILQALPLGLPSYYQNLDPMLLFRLFLPSGLTGSPIFLAILLVMLLFPAMLGAALEQNKRDRIFFLICAAVFSLTAVKTQCILGIWGTAAAILSAGIVSLCKKGGKRSIICLLTALAAFGLGLIWSFFSPAINGTYSRSTGETVEISNQLALYDGGILWKDSAYRLGSSGYYIENGSENPNGSFSISNTAESYAYTWKVTAGIIGRFPLEGTGPDCLVYPQLYQSLAISQNPNVFDRCYNYYLHLAATLGIPATLCFVSVLAAVLKRGAGICKRSGSWLYTGLFGAVILYAVMMLIGTSSVTVTPIFWMLAGILTGQKTDAQKL